MARQSISKARLPSMASGSRSPSPSGQSPGPSVAAQSKGKRSGAKQLPKEDDPLGDSVCKALGSLQVHGSEGKENAHQKECKGKSLLHAEEPAIGVTLRKKQKNKPRAKAVATDTELARHASRLSQENDRLHQALSHVRSRLHVARTLTARRSREIDALRRRLSACTPPEEEEEAV